MQLKETLLEQKGPAETRQGASSSYFCSFAAALRLYVVVDPPRLTLCFSMEHHG